VKDTKEESEGKKPPPPISERTKQSIQKEILRLALDNDAYTNISKDHPDLYKELQDRKIVHRKI
jgi:hypothetical protein